MAKGDDFTSEHFEWLVEGRSRNQRATLDLYRIIDVNEDGLSRRLTDRDTAHQLVGIAFSLWRAVFLSDLTGDIADQVTDIKRFLQSLIAHNAVLYQTDFSAREWTFSYYLDNALFRLGRLSELILPKRKLAFEADSAKEQWTEAQALLELAIARFAEVIGDR